MDPYATHIPVVRGILQSIPRGEPTAILELGCGTFSTPLLRQYIETQEHCELISLESDASWLAQVQQQLPPSARHRYLNPLAHGSWSTAIDVLLGELPPERRLWVSFIDSSPWESRTIALLKLRQESAYVVVHDSDYFPAQGLWGRVEPDSLAIGPPHNIPRRRYDDVLNFWTEYLPREFAGPTGPPTLLGSDFYAIDLRIDDMIIAAASHSPDLPVPA